VAREARPRTKSFDPREFGSRGGGEPSVISAPPAPAQAAASAVNRLRVEGAEEGRAVGGGTIVSDRT
jgi:hypothetical protein